VNDDDLRDLIEQAHLLREMQADPGWATWQRHCAKRIEAKKREMIQGVPKTIEAYRHTAGWIDGAEYALNALAQLELQIEGERDRRADKQPVTV
jgi:hypothetical protein